MPIDGVADPLLPGADELFEHAACGLLLTTADGTIWRANATFCRWVGVAPDELTGRRKISSLLTMGARIFHQTHWAPLMQIQGSVAEVKLDVVHRDGHSIPMIMNALRSVHAGVAWHSIAMFVAEDRHSYERELLKARQRAEQLLEQQRQSEAALHEAQDHLRRAAEDRALLAEQMIGIVSHDLRNPLSTIHMATLLLERDQSLSDKQGRALAYIQSANRRAQRLIADLLDMTQARVGRGLAVKPVAVDLHAVVAASIDELGLAYAGRTLTHESQGQGTCEVDADRLEQLVGNLVANAMTYGAQDRPVQVKSVIMPGSFSVQVHNEGTPIAPELIDTIFEPMKRGNVSEGVRSVGLGLFIVREIARAHGGDVTLASSAADGTTFVASFPRK